MITAMATVMARDTVRKVTARTKKTQWLRYRPGRKATGLLLLGLALALISVPLYASKLRIMPGVSVRGIYTDNADLSSSDKKSKFYYQVRPTIKLDTGEETGGRIKTDLDYSLVYTDDVPGNRGRTMAHRLKARVQAELYRDMVFLDASAGAGLGARTAGGQTGSGLGSFGGVGQTGLGFGSSGGGQTGSGSGSARSVGQTWSSGIGDTRNPVQTYTLSLSPYFKHHLGRYADLLTRYTFDQVINSGRSYDSFSNAVLMSINSGRYFSRMPWSLSYRSRKTNRQDGANDSETTSVNGNVSYILNRKWRLNLGLGKTDNNYTTNRRSSTDSVTWNAGATWTPTPRTNLDFSYGRQFFGENLAFNFNHRWRRAVWTARYTRRLTSWRTQQLAQRFDTAIYDTFQGYNYLFQDKYTYNLVGFTPDGKFVYGAFFDMPTLTDEQYVISTFNTGFSLNGRRSTLSINAHYTKRRYEVSLNNGRDYGLSVNLNRRLTPKTTGNIGLFWQKNRRTENGPEDTRLTLNAGLTKQLTERTNATLRYLYRRLDSDSSGGASEYRENQISFSLGTYWN